jgi:PAS domain S-box-containing protein
MTAARVLYVGERSGADALAAAGGFETAVAAPVEVPERMDEPWDCVVLGGGMGRESLLGLVIAVRGAEPSLPAVVFSTEQVAEDALDAGATDYVRAAGPERWTVLAARVRSAFRRSNGEERARRVHERTTESVVALTPDWTIVYVNEAAAAFLGDDPGSLVGQDFFADFAGDDEPFRERYAEAMRTQDPTTFVAESELDPGTWLEIRAYPSESGLSVYFRDVTERRRRERELETYEGIIDAAPDGIYSLDDDRRFETVNRALATAAGVEREELVGEPVEALVDAGVADAETVASAHRRLDGLDPGERIRFESEIETVRGERTVENNLGALPGGGFVNVIRDVTRRNEDRRALARQRDELETLNRINGVIRAAIAGLVGESSREGVERAVCMGLVESGLYRSAWVGATNVRNDAIQMGTAMGEWAADGPPEGPITSGPALDAVTEGSVQHVDDFGAVPGPIEDSTPPGVAVPLSRGTTVNGVLVVCADREDAFSRREREAFAVLGEVVGFALTATHYQELLFAEGVTELEFDAPDGNSAFVRASEEHDCRLTNRGFVPAGERGLSFVEVERADPETVLDTFLDAEAFESGRVVSRDGESGVLELAHTGESLVLLLTEGGARVREAIADGGESRVVADLPHGGDVRGLVDWLQAEFPAAELVGKRRRERPATAARFSDTARERLTDRQRSALRTAHLSGYYEWPRDSTAEEVAESMDIAAATLHQHLRAAEGKLLSALFDSST